MAPAASPWALGAILTWRWLLPLALGCYPDMAPAASTENPVTWLLLALALTWPPGRDVKPDLAQGLGVAQGLGCGQS